MASMLATIKNAVAICAIGCLLLLSLAPAMAEAAAFQVKRGMNMDSWTTWPAEDRWGDADVLLPFPEWRRHIGAEQFRDLRDAGLDFVRIPVDPAPFLAPSAAHLQRQLLDSVLEAVRLANAAGLKAIVDMHAIPWGDDRTFSTGKAMDDAALFDLYVEMLRKMARALAAEDPTMVALEVINEPTAECAAGDRTWPDMLKRLFAASRASATRLTLILPGACWSSAEGLSQLDPKEFPDDNLIWTFHSYAPFLLSHQSASWAGDFIPYVTGIPYPPSAVSRPELDAILERIRERMRAEAPLLRRAGLLSYLDEQVAEIDTPEKLAAVMRKPFETVSAWAKQHGVPPEDILLGEFGMIRQDYGNPFVMNPAWRAAFARDTIAIAEEFGFAWSIWSYGGSFGVVDQFDAPAEPDVMNAIRALPAAPR